MFACLAGEYLLSMYKKHCVCKTQRCNSNLEQVEDLLAQVQLKVCVVGACHVVDEHQAIPLGLEAVGRQRLRLNVVDILTNRSGYN